MALTDDALMLGLDIPQEFLLLTEEWRKKREHAMFQKSNYDLRWAEAYLQSEGKNETARKADADKATLEERNAYEMTQAEARAMEYRIEFALRAAGRSGR